MNKFTKEQAIIISGYTGFNAGYFGDLHADVEKRLGRSVWTHEFGDKEFSKKVKELYRDDFIAMCYVGE